MTTVENKKQMFAKLRRARNDIACITNWLEMELGKYGDNEIETNPESRNKMTAALRFISGFGSTEEIEESLEELIYFLITMMKENWKNLNGEK